MEKDNIKNDRYETYHMAEEKLMNAPIKKDNKKENAISTEAISAIVPKKSSAISKIVDLFR